MHFEVTHSKMNEGKGYMGETRTRVERSYKMLNEVYNSGMFNGGSFGSVGNSMGVLLQRLAVERNECAMLENGLAAISNIYFNLDSTLTGNGLMNNVTPDTQLDPDMVESITSFYSGGDVSRGGGGGRQRGETLAATVIDGINSLFNEGGEAFLEWLSNLDDETMVEILDALSNNDSNHFHSIMEMLAGGVGGVSIAPSGVTAGLSHIQNALLWQQMVVENSSEVFSESGYIENQNAFSGFAYGEGHWILNDCLFDGSAPTGADNLCGVIATYNALNYLGNGDGSSVQLPELIYEFENDGIVLNGCFGTSPIAIQEYIEEQGYSTSIIVGDDITSSNIDDLQQNYDTYILTAYNTEGHIENSMHTVSITYEAETDTYHIHNSSQNDHTYGYGSLEEAINSFSGGDSDPISIIGISGN